jgi:hypothetical protein
MQHLTHGRALWEDRDELTATQLLRHDELGNHQQTQSGNRCASHQLRVIGHKPTLHPHNLLATGASPFETPNLARRQMGVSDARMSGQVCQ